MLGEMMRLLQAAGQQIRLAQVGDQSEPEDHSAPWQRLLQRLSSSGRASATRPARA